MAPASSPSRARVRLFVNATVALVVLSAPLVPVAANAVESSPGLLLDVSNDADGDGTFTDAEQVEGAGHGVTFRVVVTNATELPLTITSLTDTMLDTELDLLQAPWCPDLAGLAIAPSGSAVCTFTIDGYLRTHGPQPRDELRNVVRVTAQGDGGEVEASDDSLVTNENAGRVSVAVDVAVDADGDGVFSDQERAPAPARDVTFRVVVRNTSPGAVVIADLVATWPGLATPTAAIDSCPELGGMRLWGVTGGGGSSDGHEDGGHDDGSHDDGGHERPTSATCTFGASGWSPAPGGSRTATVTVRIEKGHSPDRAATAADSATVTTPLPPPTIGLETRVARTGDGPFEDHDDAPGLQVSIPAAGAEVFHEFAVTNTGARVLTELALEDTQVDVSTCVLPTELAPADTYRCVVGPVGAVAGAWEHTARVTARGDGMTATATDAAHYRGSPAGLRLTVAAAVPLGADGHRQVVYDPDAATVDYRFTITNTGEVTLLGLALHDELLGSIAVPQTPLAAGESTVVRVTRVLTEEDAVIGVLDTAAAASAVTGDGVRVTDSATEQVLVVEVLGAVLARAGSDEPAVLGAAAMVAFALGATLLRVGRGRRPRSPRTT